ncbi:MAG: hypothetical protein ABFS34_13465 [Gemmatimonadota bacterium]
MTKSVREPIQVYLTGDERRVLDDKARSLGVSRSEVLRRGVLAMRQPSALGYLPQTEAVTAARTPPGEAPPSLPMASLKRLLSGLTADRSER